MSVCYLDVDDEITDAIARLKGARDGRVVVVVPPGSRIATSRINFKLLAREADVRGLVVLFVSGDAGVRALAGSAGMATAASVAEAEVAMGLPVTGAMPGGSSGGLLPVVAAAPGLLAAAPGSAAAPARRRPPRARSRRLPARCGRRSARHRRLPPGGRRRTRRHGCSRSRRPRRGTAPAPCPRDPASAPTVRVPRRTPCGDPMATP